MRQPSLRKLALTTCLLAIATTLCGCGSLPATTEPTGATLVFAAFEGPEDDAPTIQAIALVIVGGVRGLFNGLAREELILRNIPFGDEDPPRQPMTVTAPGYKTIAQQVELRADIATFIDLTMEKVDLTQTGTVGGVVRDTAGQPIVNALVGFLPEGGAAADALEGFTDAQGQFLIGGIPIGPVTVEAVAAGFLPDSVGITVQPDEGGTNDDLSFSLLSGQTAVTVRGVVKDLRLESPLSGAEVSVADRDPVVTGADGRFEFGNVLVGLRPIRITLSGYDQYDDEINVLPGMGDVVALMSRASGEPPTVPYTVAGTVTILGSADNSGATVTAYDIDRGMQMASYTTAADGRYYLFVPAGRYEITATVGVKSISRDLDYAGGGRVVDGIDFTLSVSP